MRQIVSVTLTVLFITLSLACGGGSGDDGGGNDDLYTNSNLPSKYAVTIPSSVKSSSSPGLSIHGSRMYRASSGPGSSGAYGQLQMEIDFVRMFMLSFEMEFMMWDVVYDDMMAQMGASTTKTISGLKITVTQEMINKFKATLPPEMTSSAPPVGTVVDVPTVDVTLDASDSDGDGYNFTLSYSMNQGGMTTSTTVKWNTAKTQSYTASSMDDGTYQHSFICTFDSTTNAMNLQMAGEDGIGSFSVTISMQEKGANNEIYLTSNTKFVNGSGTTTYNLTGRADDNGGSLQLITNEGQPTEQKTKETFDGSGNITGKANWDYIGGDWAQIVGYVSDDPTVYIVSVQNVTVLSGNLAGNDGTIIIVSDPLTDPASNPDNVIGALLYNGGIVDSCYWGTAGQLSVDVGGGLFETGLYLETYNTVTNEFQYTRITGVTLELL